MIPALLVWLACGGASSTDWMHEPDFEPIPMPLDVREIHELNKKVQTLRAQEKALVEEKLAAGEDDASVRVMAQRLGMELPAEERWSPPPLNGRQEGVRMDHGRAVLEGVREEYLDVVPRGLTGRAAARALGVEATDSPEEAIQQAIRQGRPESEAVVIGVEAALHALDPYTQPVWPREVQAWSEHHEGVSVGVGVELDEDGAGVFVSSIDPLGPAWSSGLHVGDRVRTVDGEAVASLPAASARLGGEPGSKVTLGVVRNAEEVGIELERTSIPRQTVWGWKRLDGKDGAPSDPLAMTYMHNDTVAYVRLTSFVPDTDDALAEVALPEEAQRLVLDLRGNPGGDVQAALNVADAWLEDGIVVQMSGRAAPLPEPPGPGEAAWNDATPGGPFVGMCTVVLVDADTASAAEILAGVLQQRAGAIVVGAPTAGKAVSQALRADEGLGVAWQVTNLAWALPDGTRLVEGVTPDERYEPSAAESWQTARMAAKRQAPKRHADGTPMPWLGPAVAEGFVELDGDPMLLRGVRALRGCGRK